MSDVKVRKELVTPAKAKNYLEKNKTNRRLSKTQVRKLSFAMQTGDWLETGDTHLKFDTKGNLIDGQHTLHAIIASNKTIPLNIAEGISSKAFKVIDTGKPRSAGDVISSLGYSDAGAVSRAVTIILNYHSGYYNESRNVDVDKRGVATTAKVVEFLETKKNAQEVCEIVEYCKKYCKTFRFIAPGTLAALAYITAEKHASYSDEFLNAYFSSDHPDNHPIGHLRNKLMKGAVKSTNYYTQRDKMALYIKAWNHCRTKRKSVPEKDMALDKGYPFPKIL